MIQIVGMNPTPLVVVWDAMDMIGIVMDIVLLVILFVGISNPCVRWELLFLNLISTGELSTFRHKHHP